MHNDFFGGGSLHREFAPVEVIQMNSLPQVDTVKKKLTTSKVGSRTPKNQPEKVVVHMAWRDLIYLGMAHGPFVSGRIVQVR